MNNTIYKAPSLQFRSENLPFKKHLKEKYLDVCMLNVILYTKCVV